MGRLTPEIKRLRLHPTPQPAPAGYAEPVLQMRKKGDRRLLDRPGLARRRPLKYLAWGMLPLSVLFIALSVGPIGLATGIPASHVVIWSEYRVERIAPEDLAVLAENPELEMAGRSEESQLAQERRSRRIERASTCYRSSKSGRVTMAG